MRNQSEQNTNRIRESENKIVKLETIMPQLQQQLNELKRLVSEGFIEIKNEIHGKDDNYNKKFATKEELKMIQKLNDSKRLLNNPLIWIIIATSLSSVIGIVVSKIIEKFL